MKQEPGSMNCVAVAVAMATNTTAQEFEATINRPEHYRPDFGGLGYDLHECARYLNLHNMNLGFGIVKAEGNDSLYIKAERDYAVPFDPKKLPALVSVVSETISGCEHVLYWDGEQIHDPNPNVPDGRPLSDYEITEWWPIIQWQSMIALVYVDLNGAVRVYDEQEKEIMSLSGLWVENRKKILEKSNQRTKFACSGLNQPILRDSLKFDKHFGGSEFSAKLEERDLTKEESKMQRKAKPVRQKTREALQIKVKKGKE